MGERVFPGLRWRMYLLVVVLCAVMVETTLRVRDVTNDDRGLTLLAVLGATVASIVVFGAAQRRWVRRLSAPSSGENRSGQA
ncbi:MAG: hypothetical protein NTV23_01505 [Propionibacteriales bacterium]|nr:hypothetical protein [Propionibacteriales bacterium]